MDNHDRKRVEQIARTLAETAVVIQMTLMALDDIRLHRHEGPDMRERLAEDLAMVHADILPAVEAPPEILAIVGSTLLDWMVLNDLIDVVRYEGYPARRLSLMETVAERLTVTLQAAADILLAPGEED